MIYRYIYTYTLDLSKTSKTHIYSYENDLRPVTVESAEFIKLSVVTVWLLSLLLGVKS